MKCRAPRGPPQGVKGISFGRGTGAGGVGCVDVIGVQSRTVPIYNRGLFSVREPSNRLQHVSPIQLPSPREDTELKIREPILRLSLNPM